MSGLHVNPGAAEGTVSARPGQPGYAKQCNDASGLVFSAVHAAMVMTGPWRGARSMLAANIANALVTVLKDHPDTLDVVEYEARTRTARAEKAGKFQRPTDALLLAAIKTINLGGEDAMVDGGESE